MQLNAIERSITALESLIERDYSKIEMNLKEIEDIIAICDNVISLIKQRIRAVGFNNFKEEEYFFKYLKPRLCSNFVYFLKLYKIKLHISSLTKKKIKRFFKEENNKIDYFISSNSELLTYYNSNATHLDSHYFRRSENNINIGIEYRSADVDKTFCTPKGHLITKFIANKKLSKFIENYKAQLLNKSLGDICPAIKKLNWNKSNVDLVELIYALKLNGSIPESIKDISAVFQQIFDVNLSNISRSWVDIKNRKIKKAKFLSDTLHNFNKNIKELDY